MKLLFLTPVMGNWVRWGAKHIAANPLHAQLAAFLREKRIADVAVLDCRALKDNRIESLLNGYTSPYPRMKFETYKAAADLIDQ